MSLSLVVAQILTGLTFGMLYFLIAVGLSIILGVMNVVNLAHGSMFVLGSLYGLFFHRDGLISGSALILSLIIPAYRGHDRTLFASQSLWQTL